MRHLLLVGSLAALGISGAATAASVSLVANGSIAFDTTESFDTVANDVALGGILDLEGISFAESFVGQTVTISGGFDQVSGTPTGPLSLQAAAAADQNLYNLTAAYADVLTGLTDGVGNSSIGEGAIAGQFDISQSGFAFDVVGADGGTMDISFYNASGGLIDSQVVALGSGGTFTFEASGDSIAGFVITNANGGGVGYDNFQFNVIPLPAPLAMGLLGLGAVAARRRFAGASVV